MRSWDPVRVQVRRELGPIDEPVRELTDLADRRRGYPSVAFGEDPCKRKHRLPAVVVIDESFDVGALLGGERRVDSRDQTAQALEVIPLRAHGFRGTLVGYAVRMLRCSVTALAIPAARGFLEMDDAGHAKIARHNRL